MSHHLNARQVGGLNKLGDCMLPGDEQLPSFSQMNCVSEVDRILDYMPAQDLSDLKMLLMIFSFLPTFLLAFLLRLLELSPAMPGGLGSLLRFIRLGIRGLVMTLYYGNSKAHTVIHYQVGVYTDDLLKKT